MFPVSALPKDKANSGGPFDKAIEKAVKAIKTHSIQTKPERKPGRQNDPEYRAFLNRREFNPFLHSAWMLMAKSQFYNGDFLEAASSFSYISRLYETQPEIAIPANIWKARCFAEMGWFYDADEILSRLNYTQLSKNQRDWRSAVYADLLIKQKQYAEAIPHLAIAIQSERNKQQRTRQKYLLGQLYAATGQNESAYRVFREVAGSNAPYTLELSARIRQTEVYPGGDIERMSRQLNQMLRNRKNAEYLDQIYYALGNLYMTVPDTVKAIQSYESGVEKSVRGGIDKALNQLKLGDIYFNQRKFLNAQPNYSEALGQLKKSDEAYPRVAKRSEALDALVIHFEAVELQDSLQRLSRMPETERLAVVNKIIEDLINKEREDQARERQADYDARQSELLAQQQSIRPGVQPAASATMPQGGDPGAFYFYNPQAVTVGRNTFQQRWGRRSLEDDWRRRNRSGAVFDFNETPVMADNTDMQDADDFAWDSSDAPEVELTQPADAITASTDPKDPQFYLQQIPVTEEELVASDRIISNGLFNMGIIYKDMLEDSRLALETFETLNTRFPYNENKLMAYYNIYLIHWRENNMQLANLYKSRIRAEFPESDLAVAMADPDYEYNQRRMDFIQDSLYQQTYADYLDGRTMSIRRNYEWFATSFSQSKLMPKFMFLNALSFVQTNDAETFRVLLNELIDKYPQEDVSALASEMMRGFQRGLILSASGDNMLARGSLFNIRFRMDGEEIIPDSLLQFSVETATPHELLLVYPKGILNDNLLLFEVAGFNFGNYMIYDFGLERASIGEIGILRIKGFSNQEEVIQYLSRIQQPDGYAREWGQAVVMVPISEENYSILMKGKNLDEYMTFFESHFAQGNENLIAQWRLKQAEELEILPDDDGFGLLPATGDETIEETLTEETQQLPTELPVDFLETTLPADSVEAVSSEALSTPEADTVLDRTVDSANTIYNQAYDRMDNLSNTVDKISSDPIRWFLGLFKRNRSNNAIQEYAKQQEREERERQRQLKREQDEREKATRAEARLQEREQGELIKRQEAEERAALRARQQEQRELAKQRERERKQAEAERKRLIKEKEEEQKQTLKRRQEELKAREKARREELQRRERERRELQRQREQERRERLRTQGR
jgi:hypothetical protein